MDLDDQANAMAGLQRQGTNNLIAQAINAENSQAEAARVISYLEQVLQHNNDVLPVYLKVAAVSINELAIKKIGFEELPVSDFNEYYPCFSSDWYNMVSGQCGSSIELRRALAKVVKDAREFHESVPAEVVSAYLESLELIRKQIPNERWAANLASVTKNPSEISSFPASADWKNLMNLIKVKFEDLGYPFEKLFDKRDSSACEDSLLMFVGLAGFPIDYMPSSNEFIVDQTYIESIGRPLFEANGQLVEIESISDISSVSRCFLRNANGDEMPYSNYVLNWEFGKTSGQSPREIEERAEKSDDELATLLAWLFGIIVFIIAIIIMNEG